MGYYRYTVLYTCYHFVSVFLGHVTVNMVDLSVISMFSGCMLFRMLFQGGLAVLKKKDLRYQQKACTLKHIFPISTHILVCGWRQVYGPLDRLLFR